MICKGTFNWLFQSIADTNFCIEVNLWNIYDSGNHKHKWRLALPVALQTQGTNPTRF